MCQALRRRLLRAGTLFSGSVAGVCGLGFGDEDVGFGIWGGLGVQYSGFGILGSGFSTEGFGLGHFSSRAPAMTDDGSLRSID